MAIVPKGLLRYYVLELISKKPISGSEIMNEIEEASGGLWRPSPGSIYPLLEWLRDRGCIKEATVRETGIKKYVLTYKGRKLLEEQREIKNTLKKSWKFFAPHFLNLFYVGDVSDEKRELIRSVKYFMQSFVDLEDKILEKNYKDCIEDVVKILKNAAEELNEVRRRLEKVG
ncbi:MAG: PadR family transcriptional regulator [Candidatus Caldarchaeales archaeon]